MTRLLACHGFRLSQRLCQSHCQLCKTELTALILDNCKVECCRAIGVAMSEPLSCLRRFPASVSPGLDVVQQPQSCVFLAPMCLLLSTATGLTNTYPSNLYSNPKSSQHKEQRYPAPSSSSAADGRSPICCAVASMSLSGALLSSARVSFLVAGSHGTIAGSCSLSQGNEKVLHTPSFWGVPPVPTLKGTGSRQCQIRSFTIAACPCPFSFRLSSTCRLCKSFDIISWFFSHSMEQGAV